MSLGEFRKAVSGLISGLTKLARAAETSTPQLRPWSGYHKKWLPVSCMVLGVAAITLAASADLIVAGRKPGWGGRQTFVAGGGAIFLIVGAFLASPTGQRYLQDLTAPSAESKRPISGLGIAIWFGLVTGLSEVAILAFRKLFYGAIIARSQHFVWMIPLGEMSLFLMIALVIRALTRLWQNLAAVRSLTLVFTLVTSFSILLLFPGVHILGSLVLSLGLAVQLSRFVAAHEDFFNVFVRRTLPILIAVMIILWAGTNVWLTLPEWLASNQYFAR